VRSSPNKKRTDWPKSTRSEWGDLPAGGGLFGHVG
jgi:hypothetical protein